MLANTKRLFSLRSSAGGFTIPELTVSMTVFGIMLVGLLSASTYFFTNIIRNNTMVEMTVEAQNLLRSTVEELRYGAGVRETNTVSDPNTPAGGWNTSNAAFVIIIAVPAINTSGDYIVDPDTGSPYNNELVYFKSGSILFKRTLAHPDATGNRLKTSCPEAIASPSCPADRKLAETLNVMDFTLYDQDNTATTDPLLARSVKIDLSLQKDTFGGPVALDTSIRVTLRNTF